jgi:hypothetical protein
MTPLGHHIANELFLPVVFHDVNRIFYVDSPNVLSALAVASVCSKRPPKREYGYGR